MATSTPPGEHKGAGKSPRRYTDLDFRGGAGTLRGVDYQLRVGVCQGLEMVASQLLEPQLEYALTVEPLLVSEGSSEKWDLMVEPPVTVTEAKAKLQARDLKAFLAAAAASDAERVQLVFGEGAGRLQDKARTLIKLSRTARDREHFDAMMAKASREIRGLYELLGPHHFETARRIALVPYPDEALSDEVERRALALAGSRADDLIDLMHRRFSVGAGERMRWTAQTLLAEMKRRRIALQLPPGATARLLPDALRSVLLILQAAKSAVPCPVLAQVVGVEERDLHVHLAELVRKGVVLECEDGWALESLAAPLADPGEPELLVAAQRSLLDWIHRNDRDPRLQAAVAAAIELGRATEKVNPEGAARLFREIEKPLKRRGDVCLVRSVANFSIRGSELADDSDAMREEKAFALVCGRAWALGRFGELKQARSAVTESHELGKRDDLASIAALCVRSMGELDRMEAEGSPQHRANLLAASVIALTNAAESLGAARLYVEAGEAYLLLGQTHLDAGELLDAHAAIADAERHLAQAGSRKAELLIAKGDLAREEDRGGDARRAYDEAVAAAGGEPGVQALATYRRGLANLDRGVRKEAVRDFEEADRSFRMIGDHDQAALPKLELLRLSGDLPDRGSRPMPARLFERESPQVQVAAVAAHQAELEAQGNGVMAFRKEPPLSHWREMFKRAHREVAGRRRSW